MSEIPSVYDQMEGTVITVTLKRKGETIYVWSLPLDMDDKLIVLSHRERNFIRFCGLAGIVISSLATLYILSLILKWP